MDKCACQNTPFDGRYISGGGGLGGRHLAIASPSPLTPSQKRSVRSEPEDGGDAVVNNKQMENNSIWAWTLREWI